MPPECVRITLMPILEEVVMDKYAMESAVLEPRQESDCSELTKKSTRRRPTSKGSIQDSAKRRGLGCVNEAVEPSFRTLRKYTDTGETDLLNFDWNQSAIPAGISGFTECSERRL